MPCELCIRDGLDCTYMAPYCRGRRRRKATSSTSATPSLMTHSVSSASDWPSEPRADGQDAIVLQASPVETNSQNLDSSAYLAQRVTSRTSPTPGERDRQGHFIGISSGLGFLFRLHRRLNQNTGGASSQTSIFTLGDPALPPFDEMSFAVPTLRDAHELTRTYFELASPTYRFLHRPTVESWIKQLYDNGSITGPHSNSKYAVVLSMFAQASRYRGDVVSASSLEG